MANYSAGTLEVALVTSAEDVSNIFATLNQQLAVTNKLVKTITNTVYGKRLNKIVSNPNGKNKNQSNGTFGFLNSMRWTAVIYLGRKLGTVVSNIARHGADYTETLNLWETSMGSNVDQATQFVDKMNEAYGISEKTLMNAQAIFKNMLGSLGQITDTMAYQLSEGITQMAVDYASLYNVTFEQAFSKFQAVLAGQVRPIRSVAGYDITETTLFQLYQSLGGTKSMRQLTRTEKQLLSILAVFEQMERSGALGDLKKTMSTFANQTRIMAEAWQQAVTYAGALITYSIQESGILTKINAILIFIGNVLEALAEEMGAIQSFGGGIFEDLTDGANSASLALDEVNGKLLDFDKFRALSGQDNSNIGLDEKLISALSGYDTILKNANLEAEKLAEHFGKITGLFDDKGVFNKAEWDEFIDALETLGKVLTIIVGGALIDKITKSIKALTLSTTNLRSVLIGGIILAFWEAIEAFKEGDYWGGAIALTIGVVLVGALISFELAQRKAALATQIATASTEAQKLALSANSVMLQVTAQRIKTVTIALGAMVAAYGIANTIINQFEGEGRTVAAVCSIIVGGIMAIVAAVLALKSVVSWGTALPVLLAGVGAAIAGVQGLTPKVEMYANGGLPDKGTMFIAGEAGAEMVYSTPSGQSGVANIQQIKQAQLQAMKEWWATAKNDIPQFQGVSESGLYEVIDGEARRRGKTFANT